MGIDGEVILEGVMYQVPSIDDETTQDLVQSADRGGFVIGVHVGGKRWSNRRQGLTGGIVTEIVGGSRETERASGQVFEGGG